MNLKRKTSLFAIPFFALSLLSGCGGVSSKTPSATPSQPPEDKPLEIGDTIKEWVEEADYDLLPLNLSGTSGGGSEFLGDFGHEDASCVCFYDLEDDGNVGSDYVAYPYFEEEDAKNGDIISLYVYVPQGGNIGSVQLQIYPSSMRDPVLGEKIALEEEHWTRIVTSFDSLETLGAIRLAYWLGEGDGYGEFYVDDINITLGEETVFTDYSYDDESLYLTYEDYFKVGCCLAPNGLRNTEIRKIVQDNFNSVTAENEAKPERILDQKACQALLKEDEAGVAITMAPFEKLYDFCEASHIGVRHHTFVWYSQTPSWFFTKDYTNNGARASRDLMLARMDNFIRVTLDSINDRWPGLVYAIDVANEAVENGGYRTNNNNWYTTVGQDYVYYAFYYANQYKEDYQKLYYNDFAFDYQPSYCRFALNNVLRDAIDEGLIDGVGLQGHLDSNANMNNIIDDAKMIYNEGLECQITELDITINGNDSSALESQRRAYQSLISKVLTCNEEGVTDINAVIVWGTLDNTSWKQNQNPLLFDTKYGKKPAYYGFLDAINDL